MSHSYVLRFMAEWKTCTERENYLKGHERMILQCLRRENRVFKAADIKNVTYPLARAWQLYLSLPGDRRPDQTLGIIHSSAWILFRKANKYAQNYQDIIEGKAPEKLQALEANLARTEYTQDDMRLVRDLR